MGVVYLALSQGPGGFAKLKVVKRLRPDHAEEPRVRQMFLDEARLAARLHHPNIVQTNEVGFDGKHYFLEMEYLEGQSFDALLRRAAVRCVTVPLPVSVWILTQTLAGLHHAHELRDLSGTPLNVVHRDVSPHNVLITYGGEVKVLDFGIAKATDSRDETATGVVKGKVTYMAPEQAAQRPIDRRADVFAVGVMLWQSMTGRRLWEGRSDVEIFLELQKGPIPSARSVRPDVPADLDAICLRATSFDPAQRFATAAEMQAALEESLEAMGARVGDRVVATLMGDLFADRREQTRADVEARIKTRSPEEAMVDIPLLYDVPAATATRSAAGQTRTTTEQRSPRGRDMNRRLWRATFTAGIVAVATGSAAGLLLRSRAARSGPGAAGPPSAAAHRECRTSLECSSKLGVPGRCRENGTCAALGSVDCKVLADAGELEDDRTVWLGVMLPLTVEPEKGGDDNAKAIDLARRDFAGTMGPLSARPEVSLARPLGVVLCDDGADAGRAARHLVDDVGVPAIIGFRSGQELIELAESTFLPKGVLAMTATNTSPLIAKMPHPKGGPRLVWRTTYDGARTAQPLAAFVSDMLEPRIRAAPRFDASRPVRVALVRIDEATLPFSEVFFRALRYNGKSAVDNGGDYGEFVVRGEKDPGGDYAAVVAKILAFEPHVVVFEGIPEEGATRTSILEPIEAGWPRRRGWRPLYLKVEPLGPDEIGFVGRSTDRRQRVFGITTMSNTPTNASLVMHYNQAFHANITRTLSPNTAYDAFYVLGYATYAVGDGPVTGAQLARAIGRLMPPGKPVEVGPTNIFDGFNTLRSGGNVDLVGSSGSLDFDLTIGQAPTDYAILCTGADGRGGASSSVESGLVYLAAQQRFDGELRCP